MAGLGSLAGGSLLPTTQLRRKVAFSGWGRCFPAKVGIFAAAGRMEEPAAVGLDVAGGNGAAGGADSGVAHGGNVLRALSLLISVFAVRFLCFVMVF